MELFKIEWKKTASKEMKQLPQKAILKALSIVENLSTDPFPVDSKKLSGTNHTYRVRFGNYRLIYNVLDQVLIIEVIRVGHRKNAYRNLP